jgi:hypothetical protein
VSKKRPPSVPLNTGIPPLRCLIKLNFHFEPDPPKSQMKLFLEKCFFSKKEMNVRFKILINYKSLTERSVKYAKEIIRNISVLQVSYEMAPYE